MIRIYGASDDLVEIDGDVVDEVDCYKSGVEITIGTQAGAGKDAEGLTVRAEHGRLGWLIGVALFDDDAPIPWPVRIETQDYSPCVVVECPPGTPVTWKKVD